MTIDMMPERSLTVDRLKVRVYSGRRELGQAAAKEAADALRERLGQKERVRVVFAAAPSQTEFLERLCREPDIDWDRVTAFHMDEYIGLPQGAPQLFSEFLKRSVFDKVRPGVVHLIDGGAEPESECRRYARLLAEAPIDFVFLGIGENGHIAFNDPPVADFADPKAVKAVLLEEACRRQQVNDGCFPDLDAVPKYALTLTIPTLLSADRLFCMVPGAAKRAAVRNTLELPMTAACPATILRSHADCTLYADGDSYGSWN